MTDQMQQITSMQKVAPAAPMQPMTTSYPGVVPPEENGGKNKLFLWIVLVVLLIALGVFAYFLLF